MIIRKYTDLESNLEVSVTEEKRVLFEIEYNSVFTSIELSYDDVRDLRDILYDFANQIQPVKPEKING